MGQLKKNVTNPYNYIVYAVGFAAGNYVGILIEQKLAIGTVIIRIITKRVASELINYLQENDFGVTVLPAEGSPGPVPIIFTVTKRSKINKVDNIIKRYHPNAIDSIEDVRYVSNSYGLIGSSKKYNLRSLFKMRK